MISLGGLSLRSTECNQTQTRGLVFSEPEYPHLFGARAPNAVPGSERLTLQRSVASPGIVAPSASLLLRRRAKVHASRDRQVERMSALPTAAVCHAGDQALRSTRAARRRFRRRSRPRACSNACEAHRKTKFSDQCMRDFPQLWIAVNVVAYFLTLL